MVSKPMLQGTWNEIVGRLHAKWGQLNQNDLEQFKGNVEALAGYIQRHTGEARESIMQFLDGLLADGRSKGAQAAETVRDYASQAASSAKQSFAAVADRARHGYADAEHFVQKRPGTSVGAVFAAGALIGFVVAMLIREG
ncbi:MAG TPA: hypothetical protein VHX65_07790 [Pirellulales bacterium]|jgi:uncharacterized protein YjbJ (UPF0337 family)|nr:hypothetical protein [Pirellulales bacterium]